MKSSVKTLGLAVLQPFAAVLLRKPHVGVVMYHSVDTSIWKYGVTPEFFKEHIEHIASTYKVVPLSEVVAFTAHGNLPHKTLALTLDDGYLDTYTVVFPLIKKHKLPLTVFLTTNLNAMDKLGKLPRLTWEQVREMHQSGLVKFEVHGRNHANLDEIKHNEKLLEEELLKCRDDIREHTGYESKYMAYAAGRRSPEVVEFIKKNGFLGACSISEGAVRKGDNPFVLRRIQIDRTMPLLLGKLRLTPAIELYRRMVSYIR